MAQQDKKTNGHNQDDSTRARGTWLMSEDLVRFLDLLRNNGNVSMSARLIGRSRSTIYAFAGKAPSFREAMREAMTEGRELLLGEGWRRATQWTELFDDDGKVLARQPPSDRLLSQLIGGYFQEFKPGRGDDLPPDELLPETADLTLLSDNDLEALERILAKVAPEDRVGAGAG